MISRPFQGHGQNCREIRPIDPASLLFIRRYVCSNICGSSLNETVDENSQSINRNSLRFLKISRSRSSSLSCVNFNRNAIHFYLIPIFNMYISRYLYIFCLLTLTSKCTYVCDDLVTNLLSLHIRIKRTIYYIN